MAVFRLAKLLIFLLYLLIQVDSQATTSVPDAPCRRFGHQAAVVSDTLYVDGGWIYANQLSINPNKAINQNVLLNNLSQLTVDSPAMPQPYKSLTKSDEIPTVTGGTLWPDEINEIVWLYGGEFDVNPMKDFQLWGFDTRLNQWNLSSDTSIASSDIQRASYGGGATLPQTAGKGYYYGGYQNNKTSASWSGSPLANSDLVEFDMQTGKTRSLRAYNDSIGMAEGSMVAIPASAAGMLIYFGGMSFSNGSSAGVALDMSHILVYDIGDNAWFAQTATGDIPANRRRFCAGAAVAQDASSYNIYMYGGFGFGANAPGFDDVYILSLPTFTWIRWSSMSYDPKIGNPHGDLTCTMVGSNQMIIMGGNFSAAPADFCDVPKQWNQHNLILGSQNENENGWNPYSPTKRQSNYFVPGLVTNVTGGTPAGGATNVKPAVWSSDKLAKYFSQTATFAHRTPTRAAVKKKGSSKSHIGAIAGGIVGVVLLLVVAAGLAWCCCIKRHKLRSTRRPSRRRPEQPIRGELSADPNRYSKQPNTYVTAVDSSYPLQGQHAYSDAGSPPAGPYHHAPPGLVQPRPAQTQQDGYGSYSSSQQQHDSTIRSELPSGVFLHRSNDQFYHSPPGTQSMSPSRTYEMDAGEIPRTYRVQQSPSQKGHHAAIGSISERSRGNFRADSASQSTESPSNFSWKA